MKILRVVFLSLVLALFISSPLSIAGLDDLPGDVFLRIAGNLNSEEIDNLDLTNKTIHQKMSSPNKRPQKAALVRRTFPTRITGRGVYFRQRLDIERGVSRVFKKNRKTFEGEIWQQPNNRGYAGLIWFPVEKLNGRPVELSTEEAQKYCSEKYALIGIQASIPTRMQFEHAHFLMSQQMGPFQTQFLNILPDPQIGLANLTKDRKPFRCVFQARIGGNYDVEVSKDPDGGLREYFTRRTDLERYFSNIRQGEIWQMPPIGPTLGQVWLSIEKKGDGSTLTASFPEAKAHCEAVGRELGISLRVPTYTQANQYGFYLHTYMNSAPFPLEHPLAHHLGEGWWVDTSEDDRLTEAERGGTLCYNSLDSFGCSPFGTVVDGTGFVRCVYEPALEQF